MTVRVESCFARRLLSLCVASACVIPLPVLADNQQIADGVNLALAAGDYTTTDNGAHVLYARNGGSLTALGPVTLSSTGNSAYDVMALGAGSSITLVGGTLVTNGQSSHALVAWNGTVDVLADPTGTHTAITTSGAHAHGAWAATSGSVLNLDRVSISTQGRGAEGVKVDGGALTLSGSYITTFGVDTGIGSAGVHIAGNGAHGDITGSAITAAGDALYLDNRATARLQDSVLTSGTRYGVLLLAGSSADVQNTRIQTVAAFGNGLQFNNASQLTLGNVNVSTLGSEAEALFASGASGAITGNNVRLQTSGFRAAGIDNRAATISLDGGSVLTSGQLSHAVYAQGKTAANTLSGFNIHTQGQQAYGVSVWDGAITTLNGSNVLTNGAQSWAGLAAGQGSRLVVNGGTLSAAQSGALFASNGATIDLSGNAQVSSGTNLLLGVGSTSVQPVTLSVRDSQVVGDIRWTDGTGTILHPGTPALANVTLDQGELKLGTHWTGATDAVNQLTIGQGSTWTMTDNSTVGQVILDRGTIEITPPSSGGYKTLDVTGNFSGSGGTLAMNVLMNEGGALARQQTDRLLIHGDVTTTGSTYLKVTPQGNGALTDTTHSGMINAADGISVVQVAGQSRADAFALQGDYVTVGAWQYTLHAFGPGETSADQNALGSDALNWDYRLGNKYVAGSGGDGGNGGDGSDGGNTGDGGHGPIPEGGGKPIDPPPLAPQMPSYIVAPTALLHYGDQMIGTLHQRLGEIRNVAATGGLGGEIFARYIGTRDRYRSDLSSAQLGYGFNQQINAVQVGGSLLGWTGDTSSLRAGLAFDKGTTHVRPNARAGEYSSHADYDAYGTSAWLTWQQDNGFYLDAVVGSERYRGKVSVSTRGEEATVNAHGWTASLEAGYPFAVGGGWSVEPQAQVAYQSLRFRDILDQDGTLTRIASGGQTTTRLGVRAAKSDDARLAPYGRFDLINSNGGRARITASDTFGLNVSDSFAGGRVGLGYRVGGGVTSQLTQNVALYGEVDYLGALAGHGYSGWSANAGVRLDF